MANSFLNFKNIKKKLVLDGFLVGLSAGFFSLAYRFILGKLDVLRNFLYEQRAPVFIGGMILLSIVMALIIGKLIIFEPLSSGSGIPQVSGEALGLLDMNPYKVLVAKIIGGALANTAGLSLGREGPSIQIGASMGKIISRLLKRDRTHERYLISAGASAGLSAAFNAPLAGALFSIEEIHKVLSPYIIVPCLIASVTADFFSKYVFGLKPVFSFYVNNTVPLNLYWAVIILGIISGLVGILFNKVLLKGQDLYNKSCIDKKYRVIIPMLTAVILGYTYPYILGGGHHLLEELTHLNFSLFMLLVLLIMKLLFTSESFGSSVQGGIFLPVLVLGGITGYIIFTLIKNMEFDFIDPYTYNFVIIAMAGILTSVVRAPILSVVLVTEMTGSFSHLLTLTLASIIAYITAETFKSEPIYESLLIRLLKGKVKENHGNIKGDEKEYDNCISHGRKIINSFILPINSSYTGKMIKDIGNKSFLIVSIERNGEEIIPRGDSYLKSGDRITIIMDEDSLSDNKKLFIGL